MIHNNQLCPPYPECIEEYVGYQDITACPEMQIGDINYDGIIDILDIVIIIDMILNSEYDIMIDINEDGILNVLDIIQLINLILE